MPRPLVPLVLAALSAALLPAQELGGPIAGRRQRASSTDAPDRNRDHAVIAPRQNQVIAELQGPGEIRHIWFTVSTKEFRYPATTILRIHWDGHPEPSVQAPLGDFFAAGNGMRAVVDSAMVQCSAEGRAYSCWWPMPFARSARIAVENQSDHPLTALYFYIDWLQLERPRPGALYFHAQFRQERPHEPGRDYTMLETTGAGYYVGTVLSVQNGFNAWFGEGDDRFYIDGEAAPSLQGTGTEDYFDDAWGFRRFNHPYAGCTIFEGRSIDSRTTAYRWHVRDPITFRRSLRATIENKGWIAREDGGPFSNFHERRDNLSSVAFWYQETPAAGVPPVPPRERRLDPEIFREGESWLESAAVHGRGKAVAGSERTAWSRRFLHLRDAAPGDSVELAVEVAEKGRYSLSIWPVLMAEGGIYRVALDDTVVEPRLDTACLDPVVQEENLRKHLRRRVAERKLGLHTLDAGTHRLRFTCLGGNPAGAGCDLGLDCVSLRKIAFEDMDRFLGERPR